MTDECPVLLNYYSLLRWWRSIYNSPWIHHTAHAHKSSCWNCVRCNYWCGRRTRNRNTTWTGLSFTPGILGKDCLHKDFPVMHQCVPGTLSSCWLQSEVIPSVYTVWNDFMRLHIDAFIKVWWNFDNMQIIFKAITGSSSHTFWWERTVWRCCLTLLW